MERHDGTRSRAAPRVGWGDGRVFTGFSARTPLVFLPASPLSRRPICRWGIPAVATSWELEWNGPPVAGCQSRPSWCRGKRRIRLPTPRPVKASDPVGSAVRRGGGRVPRAWGFAPDLTVTSQTSGSAHGGGPQSPDLQPTPAHLTGCLSPGNPLCPRRFPDETCQLETGNLQPAFHSVLGSLQPADEDHFHPTRPPSPYYVIRDRPLIDPGTQSMSWASAICRRRPCPRLSVHKAPPSFPLHTRDSPPGFESTIIVPIANRVFGRQNHGRADST